jgi:hypothetical protein
MVGLLIIVIIMMGICLLIYYPDLSIGWSLVIDVIRLSCVSRVWNFLAFIELIFRRL